MKIVESLFNLRAHFFINEGCLSEIPKIKECTYCNNKPGRNSASNNCENIMLNIKMLLSSDLLQSGDSFLEAMKCCMWV
jgi:hypothetical protein